jgi:predicted outer membrane repeat protein
MKRQILISLVILLSIQALAGAGNTYYVPSRDYPTIQSAINAAAVANDDVVVVAPGVYTGSGNVDLDFNGKAITVKSQINLDNPNWDIISSTIIDCQGNQNEPHRAFYFRNSEGNSSKVIGFTIRNGYSRGPKGADGQIGYDGNPLSEFDPVSVDPTADPTTLPPRALNGDAASGDGYGGAILCAGASPTIKYCVITDCTVTGAQGGNGASGQDGPWEHWTLGDEDPCFPGQIAPDAVMTPSDDGQWGGYGGDGSGNGYGGAIACISSSPIISDCAISDNFARGGCGGNGGNGGNATEPPDYDQGDESGGGDAGNSIGDGIGGAIYCNGTSNPTIENCTFSNNIAATGTRGTGGQRGIGNETDPRTPEGSDSLVISNGGIAGGAAYYSYPSSANFTNCIFTGNKAYEAYVYYETYLGEDISAYTVGGALYSDISNTIALDTCKFTGNLGGAVYCDIGCNLIIDDCSFSDNSETANGGAIYIDSGGSLNIQNSIFGGNSAYDDGGALKCKSDTTLTNCSFGNNRADSDNDGSGYGGAMDAYQPGTTLTVNFNSCSFTGNQAIYGGGFSSENFDVDFVNCYFIGNTALRGGGLDLAYGDVSVIGGAVKGNNATDGDGGGFNCSYTITAIRDCTITDNSADGVYPSGGDGGAINFYGGASPQKVFNCLITGNSAAVDGGAIFCHYASPEIGNCTFSGNSADGYGGAIFSDFASEPRIIDCIFEGCNNHAIHEEDPGGNAIVTYSLFYVNPDGDYYDSDAGLQTGADNINNNVLGAHDNIDGNPLFVSGDLGSYYLRQSPPQVPPESPAVDSGSNTAVSLGLVDTYTTRTDNVVDTGQVDIGYHYPASVEFFELTAIVISGNGTIEPPGGTYCAGTVVTLTATPGSGWRIKAWSGTDDDSSTATTNTVVMNSHRAVTVEFEQPKTLIVAVGGGGEGFYSNLTDALHDAENGDTIVVYPGVYYGPQVQFNKDVEIRSQHPDDPNWVEQTIIDSTGHAGPVFVFDSDRGPDCILNGLTIQNSTWYTDWGEAGDTPGENGVDGPGGNGGAIWIDSGAGPVIKNCLIRDNLVHGGFGGNGAAADETHNAGRGGWGGWGYGGAIYCNTNSSPTFINCRIIDNQAIGGIGGNGGDWDEQGGSANYGGNWSRAEWWNRRTDGLEWEWVQGDLWEVWLTTLETDPYIVGPPYIGDYRWYSGYGGGIFIDKGCNVTFVNCTISGNLAQGGLSGLGGEEPGAGPLRAKPWPLQYEIPSFGGGVYCAADSTVTFTGCTITDNVSSEPLFDHTILVDGFDLPTEWIQDEYDPLDTYSIDPYLGHGGGVCAEDTATVIFTDCQLSGNKAAVGGGIHGGSANLRVSDCEFISNTAYQGGGLFAEHGPATINNSNFTDNIASSDANEPNALGQGGAMHFWATDADIIDCNINRNQAEASGGGVYFGGESAPSLTNCLLTENTAGRDGGGISANIFNQLAIFNCTIAGNIATGIGFEYGYGGGLYCSHNSYTNLIDSILWGNTSTNGPQIAIGTGFEYDPQPSTIVVNYSDVQGERPLIFVDENCTLYWGIGNIYANPRFVTGPLGNYYLSQTSTNDPDQTTDSPCVDAGSDLSVNAGLHLHTTRTDEVFDTGIVDMGYHYPPAHPIESCGLCDLSNDGIVNFADHTILMEHWSDEGCSDANDWCDGADLTFDSSVNFDDLDVLYGCWLAEDTEAPTPNPSKWEIAPYPTSLISPYDINMIAEATFDNWGGVVTYYFECTTGNGSNRVWDPDRTHIDSDLDPDTVYGYRVRARDERGNETLWSVIRYAITGEEPPPEEDHNPPTPNPMTWAIEPYATSLTSIAMVATTATDDTAGVEYYFEDFNTPSVNSGWQISTTWEDTGLEPDTTYTYRVKARDTSFWQNETSWSETYSVTTPTEEPPPLDTTPPTPDPSQWAAEGTLPDTTGAPTQYFDGVYYWHTMTAEPASDAESEPVEYYFELVAGGYGPTSSGWQSSNVYDYPVSTNPAQYGVYRVKTRDAVGNETAWSEMRSTLE